MRKLFRLFAMPATLISLRVGGAIAAFAISLILARNMAPAEMGRAMFLMSLAILLGSLASAGIEAGAVRFIAKYRHDVRLDKARGFIRLNRLIVWLFGPTLCLAVVAVLWVQSMLGQATLDVALVVALITAVVGGFLRVGAAHAMAFGKVIRSLAPSTFIRQIFFLAVLAAYISVLGRPNALDVIGMFLVGNLMALGVQFLWNRGITIGIDGGHADVSDWREWMQYGLLLAPTLLFVQYARDLTIIFAAWGLAPEDIAVLSVATALVAFIKFGVAAINQSITPKMAKLIAEDKSIDLQELINTSNHMKMWPALLCLGLVMVFGEAVLGIFGEAFQGQRNILMILMLEPLALAFFGPAGQYISLSGRQRALLPIALIALSFMMIAINVGAWYFGLTGAAFGVAVTWIAWSGYLAFYVRQRTGMDLTFVRTCADLMEKQNK